MHKTVGVLALQGDYHKHTETLLSLGVKPKLVRKATELDNCDALILPGGESTTMSLLIQEYDLYDAIKSFAETQPVMGVCAGMIMMATEVNDKRITPLGIIPFKALRNHYGGQAHSFTADIELNFTNNSLFHAHFIRAPGIGELSSEVKMLSTYNNEVVMIGSGKHIALSFHPELTDDTRVHEFWLDQIH